MGLQGAQNSQNNREKEEIGGLTLFDFKAHCKAMGIKTVWYWPKDRHIDEWNRIESLEINPNIYGLTFNKGAKSIQWGK